jgi:hypothetical protein
MNVKSVTNNLYISNNTENSKKRDSEGPVDKVDKAEISEKAKEMSRLNPEDKDIESYRQKVLNKFYDSEEVINKISSEILKEVDNKQ